MSLLKTKLASVFLLIFSASSAVSDPLLVDTPETGYGLGVGLNAGTLGLNAELSYKLGNYAVLRGNAGGYVIDYKLSGDDIDYGLDAKMLGGNLILDVHPFANGFRLSFGGRYQDFSLTGNAVLKDGDTIGNNQYTPAQLGTLSANIAHAGIAPYVGIGYDSAHFKTGSWSMNIEIGALYVGEREVDLTATGTAQGLQADLALEEQKLNDEISDYMRFYPVLTLGAKYRF